MITSDKVAQKLAAKPNYDCCTIFDENLVAVHMHKTKLYFNKPVYLGMSILDLSHPLCMTFITTILRPYITTIIRPYSTTILRPSMVISLFTDTDSLAYEIRTKDFYKDINSDIGKRFDTSDYQSNHSSGIKHD